MLIKDHQETMIACFQAQDQMVLNAIMTIISWPRRIMGNEEPETEIIRKMWLFPRINGIVESESRSFSKAAKHHS